MRDTTGVLFKEGLQQAHKEALQPSNILPVRRGRSFFGNRICDAQLP